MPRYFFLTKWDCIIATILFVLLGWIGYVVWIEPDEALLKETTNNVITLREKQDTQDRFIHAQQQKIKKIKKAPPPIFFNEKNIDLRNAFLPDVLTVVAKQAGLNLVLSPSINSMVSLHLKNLSAKEILHLLFISNGLSVCEMNGAWFVAPRSEMIKRQQEELQLQNITEETTSLITEVRQMHFARADDIGRLLQDSGNSLLSKRGHLRVDMRTNRLWIQDIPARVIEINKLIMHFDIPAQQILIEARLASVDSDFERELGIHFSVQEGSDTNDSKSGEEIQTRYGLAVARLVDGSVLDMQLTALENEGHGELISSPKLFTSNQQTASIESGEEIPYQQSSKSGATNIAFKKAVLSLKVTPQILPGNKVLLDLQVNQDNPSGHMVLGVPTINTRQMSTHVLMKNGETIVLGGIYESNKEHAVERIPFISQIPLVGLIFQQQNVIEKKRELLIFVTPKMIA